ncbi:ADP-ribosylglycohydrolase family protein [Pseudaestuariivita atlantica]|uniref:Crystallin n=1 Tax=Pseudaestuariivita atlantica TaxID=1317121 RepID=A0A0L1JSX8_9RHOB|nr:ADP-ribosylglycohydrolase family protein [Pseudaestuariivita atlantica]KNG94488.1 hypothetical protein ATO11_03450 [Pseudaestuariivita atlantica]
MTTTDLIHGALVADAAARGLHWLYDPARIAEIAARRGSAAFVPLDRANFADAAGVFVHAEGTDGRQTQYGEALVLATRVITECGGFNAGAYQDAYQAHFGAGGTYSGYIDRPTRGTLDHLAAAITDPSGLEDEQLPAIATLPAVVHAHGQQADLETPVKAAIAVTNVHDEARYYGSIAARLMKLVGDGAELKTALRASADGHADLTAALDAKTDDSVAYGEVTGRACHLRQGVPLAFHILARADSYSDAVERNIRAGGDSAGRAILVGAVAGAAFGIGGSRGIPLRWITQTSSLGEITALLGT